MTKSTFSVRWFGMRGVKPSDIDLFIELDNETVTYPKYLDLESYLLSLFLRKIEIDTTDGVSPYILPYISREVVWV